MTRVSQTYQRLIDDIYPRLVEMVALRYQTNAEKSLQDVYQMDEDFLNLEEAQLNFLLAYREEIVEILDDPQLHASLVRLFVLSTLEFTYANNQFIHLNAAEESRLFQIYQAYLPEMSAILAAGLAPEATKSRLEALIAQHFGDLRDNLARFFDPLEVARAASGQSVEEHLIFKQVMCRQYSPAFQLEVLGIHLEHLKEPVLDLGCGKSGRLVKYLSDQGIQAYGVDRIVEDSPRLTACDWLDFPLEMGAWGSILSHMAFSNHFVFQHLYKHGDPEPYARQYMQVLAALQPGGSFYYSPGLPFIEPLLPQERYQVIRRRVAGQQNRDLYSVRVLRK